MRLFLLASVASASLALAMPAFAQSTEPVPATPPIVAPQAAPVTPAQPMPTPADPAPAQTAQAPAPAQTAQAPAPAQTAQAAVTPAASQESVCQPRTTSVHLGARGSSLNRENQNALEHAVDAASVCEVQQVTIADSVGGPRSTRRAANVRATLIRQGVPEDRINVAQLEDSEAASTGRVDVRMEFAGPRLTDQAAMTAAQARPPVASGDTPAPEAAPQPTPPAPDATPPAPPAAPTQPDEL